MSKVWGVNWKTSLSGIVTTIAGFFATNPELFDHFPEDWKDTAIFINKVLLILGGASFSVSVKDKSVTGGKVAATQEALGRTDENQKTQPTKDNRSLSEIIKKEKPRSIDLLELSSGIKTILKKNNILNLKDFSNLSGKDILNLHSIGPSSLIKIEKALSEEGIFLK